MTLTQLAGELKSAVGLEIESLGWSALERAVDARMAASGAADLVHYGDLLHASPDERQELIELLVVPETWFFRQPEAFDVLGARAQQSLTGNARVYRVLSVPCSTGEEPYSIAIALFERGIAAERFTIDAADISRRHLALAERGVFGPNSFRSDARQVTTYVRPASGGMEVTSDVRGRVRFHRGNLIADDFMRDTPPYDAIFCRNLLIYFDADSRQRALRALDRLLSDDGALFVGAADAFSALTFGFSPVEQSGASAYRKAVPAAPSAEITSVRPARSPRRRARAHVPAAQPARSPSRRAKEERPAATAFAAAPTLEHVRALADAGRLDEATHACRDHLRARGPSAEAYYLLGVLAEALRDRTAAVDAYRKALYIDPRHQETLLQLSLLLPDATDDPRARDLSARARRNVSRTQARP